MTGAAVSSNRNCHTSGKITLVPNDSVGEYVVGQELKFGPESDDPAGGYSLRLRAAERRRNAVTSFSDGIAGR
jgi:hypothetical protein